jgi:hypothetical protein
MRNPRAVFVKYATPLETAGTAVPHRVLARRNINNETRLGARRQ